MSTSFRWEKLFPFKKQKSVQQSFQKKWKLSELTYLLAGELESLGKERTARAYHSTLNGITRFNNGTDLLIEEISIPLLISYQAWMREKGNSLNTIAFYMRNLRAMYNKGVKRGLFPPSPTPLFTGIYTATDKTAKRAITVKQINHLKSKAEEVSHSQREVTNSLLICAYYFLFCFYARGISFIDMAYLKKSDLTSRGFRYCRKKTGQWIEVTLTPELKSILQFFAPMVKNSDYLFPILKPSKGNLRGQYESALRKQNKQLKSVALFCGIKQRLTTHVARHSWATTALREHIPMEVISQSLGHTSVKTTAIYLDSFEQKELDKANRKVARAIQKAI